MMNRVRCYKAVQRPVLFGGVSSKVIAVELLTGLLFFKAAGAWWVVAIYLLAIHKFLSWLFKRDHLIMEKLVAYIWQPDALHPGQTREQPRGFGGLQ